MKTNKIESLEKEIERLRIENRSLEAEKSFWHKEAILHASEQGERKIEKALLANKEWIPVSDRLPEGKINPLTEDYYEYECTAEFGEGRTDVRHYKYGDGHWWSGGPSCVDDYVTAWHERPEPYREVV